jgi:YidC/Oxa1 family membrane protein insertase
MDAKRLFTSLLIAGALMLILSFFFRDKGGAAASSVAPYSIYKGLPDKPLDPKAVPQTITLGSAEKDSPSLMAVKINTITASIDSVQLNIKQFAETYENKRPLTLFAADAKLGRPFATIGVHITLGNATREIPYGLIRLQRNDGTFESHDATWEDSAELIASANSTCLLDRQYVWQIDEKQTNATDAVLYIDLKSAGQPVARLSKRFHVDPASYEMTITHTVENLTDQVLHVSIDQLSAPALSRDDPQTDDRYFYALPLNSSDKVVNASHSYSMIWGNLRKAATSLKDNTTGDPKPAGTEFIGGTHAQMSDFAKDPLLWVASSNRFFAIIVRPLPETGNVATTTLANKQVIPQPSHVERANIDLMSLDPDTAIIRLTGHTLEVPAKKSLGEPLSVFVGPKKRDLLKGEVAAGGRQEYATYDYIKLVQLNTCALYSFCVFDQVAYSILWMLDILKGSVALGNYGVAIMILVILVRALLHPLTRASQINMAKMGKQMREVAPQLAAIKKKYADNTRKQSEETMRIYRENKINPAGGIMGCLPMLIQMPIWAALYAGLRSDIDLRHAAFIPGWINDLASPDKLLPTGALALGNPIFTIPIIHAEIYGLNLLPLLLLGVFFFQLKVTAATQPKPADEQQAQMAKMSQYTIFIFPLLLYNAPSGLNLYIFASTMGGLLDTWLVRRTLKKQGILAPTAALLPTHQDADDAK